MAKISDHVDSGQENVTEDEREKNGPGSESEYIPEVQESDSDGNGDDRDMDSPIEGLPPSANPIYRFVEMDDPSPPDPLNGLIDPIVGVKVVNSTKCTIGDFRNCSSVDVKCQFPNTMKQYYSYIEVHPPSLTKSILKGLELVLEAAEACNLLKQEDAFTLASSEQKKCTIFAQSHWNELLDGYYYQEIVLTLDAIPVLARRYLLTPKVNEPLKNKLFWCPQEFGRTVERDADNITCFLAFLIIHQRNPVNKFPVILHPDLQSCLSQLYSKLGEQNAAASNCKALIHEAIWVLIEKSSTKFLEDNHFCPFTQFLIAAHLKPHGQFVWANVISPSIGYVQWSLRVTTAKKLILISHEFGGD
ncbi:hypothetical protein GGU10DRAFT_420373 [Lentinula aff. detonsa]|uniref:Uncharacterized protein n=1 Tax=Lentinula aff. detonsa TaxID=2804958 RepID=A0AA38NIL4_9AGAR|nr:hypothetical protein GGU10DRAFT_420373 [Lentinula aff. detonsa]